MHSTTLIKVALTTSLIGIIGLFILLQTTTIPIHDISHIKMMDEGSVVRTEGVVKQIRNSTNVTFINIETIETMDIIIFDSLSLRLRPGDTVIVEGKSEEYQGETEIIADSIIKKNI